MEKETTNNVPKIIEEMKAEIEEYGDLQKEIDNQMAKFEEKFLYWVVLGSTMNGGSELRWNVGEDEMPSIEKIKSYLAQSSQAIVSACVVDFREMVGDLPRVNFGAVLEEKRGEYVKLDDLLSLLDNYNNQL